MTNPQALAATVRLSSSLRATTLAQTLAAARTMAREAGVTRVAELTHLDRVGVPVFTSVRPSAAPGSICVYSGKGLSREEAMAGAMMEALEFAWAEPARSMVRPFPGRRRDVLDGQPGAGVDLDAPLDCVLTADIVSGQQVVVPAELVFHPSPPAGAGLFGSSPHGLSAGNTLDEAAVHALCEVIERDVLASDHLRSEGVPIVETSLPRSLREVTSMVRSAGLELYLSFIRTRYGIPHFDALVVDLECMDPVFATTGHGCHPDRAIAATRAVCEALQARLSLIHGARDDLPLKHAQLTGKSFAERRAYTQHLVERATARPPAHFEDLPDPGERVTDIDSALELLFAAVRDTVGARVLRVAHTPEERPLQVVRVIVPRRELFHEHIHHVEPRLPQHASLRV